jgi:hypothetical protein
MPDVHTLVNGDGWITGLNGLTRDNPIKDLRMSLIPGRPGILHVMILGGAFEFSGCICRFCL